MVVVMVVIKGVCFITAKEEELGGGRVLSYCCVIYHDLLLRLEYQFTTRVL